jgi:N4-(beta-N-acetylglucosaminyl)-L-asparaginase
MMPDPLILSTWSFGKRANAAAWPILASSGSALDAVETACRDAEDDLSNHTVGVGGYPDRDGNVSLDASIMLSPKQRGAVAAVRRFAHPVSIARRVMQRTPHVLLAGEGAEQFAREQGFEETQLLTDQARRAWEEWKKATPQASSGPGRPIGNIEEGMPSHDTIGVLAIDSSGTIAGACSTSGLRFKLPGRVGDSPIIGHALYVDPAVGAAVATGHGELVMSVCGAFLAVECMRGGASALDAAVQVQKRIAASFDLTSDDQVGIIVLHRSGEWRSAALRSGFKVAVRNADGDQVREPDHVLLDGR